MRISYRWRSEKVSDRIGHVVYLDAYISQDNKSAFDKVPGLETIYKQRALKERDREWLVASLNQKSSA
jgi:hypothetical protein